MRLTAAFIFSLTEQCSESDLLRDILHYYGVKVTLTSDVHDTDVFILWDS